MFFRNSTAKAAGLGCILLACFHAAFAHEDEVVVTGRQVDLIGEASSASEGLVGEEELSLRPILRAGELLEVVPGMVATQHSGSGKANQYFLRGFNLDHGTDFATWYDHMPINMRTHGHGQGYTDLNFVIPELVQTISYKKGSYYAEVGDFSAAGASHMTSFNRLEQGVAEVGVGQDNYNRVLLMDSPDDAQNWLYALELQTYDGPWTDIEEDLEKVNAVVKRHWDLDDGSEASVSLMIYDNSWNSADQMPLRAIEQGLVDPLGSLDTTLGGESSRSSISGQWASEVWHMSAYAISYDMDLLSNFTYFLDDPVNGDQFEQVDERMIYGGQASYKLGEDLNHRAGVEFRYDDIEEVALYKTMRGNRLGAIRSDAVEESSVGIYWQSELQLTDRLRTVFGARYDYYDFDVASLIDLNINGVSMGANGGTADDDLFSLKANLTYAMNDWEMYVSAGQGLHSNDARGSTAQVDPVDGTSIQPVDPLVRSLGGEIGARTFLADTLNASFAIWTLTLDSELLFVGDAGNTEATRESKRSGFEATAYYNLTTEWLLDIEFAFADSKFSEPDPADPALGDHIPGALDKVVSMGLSLANETGWQGSLRWRYFGERPLNEDNSVRSDPTSSVNIRAGYQWDNLNLTADLLNVFDSDDHDIDYFYASRLQGEPAQGVEDIHFHIIEPRTLRVYAEYKF